MRVARVRSMLLVLFSAAVMAAGCGEGPSLSTVTGPSALEGSDGLTAAGASDGFATTSSTDESAALGRGRDRDGSAEADDDEDEGEADDERNGRHRSVVGFVTAVGADSLTIRGITVKVTTTTIIRHGNRRLTLAQIAIGDHAQAKGTWNADGTLTATEVKVEDTGQDSEEGEEAEVSGIVAGLTGTCPALTFTVGTTTVKTNVSTRFKEVTCATLANGARVEVKGMRQTDASILATEVKLKPEEVEGTVSELSGTCPALTFKIGTTVVKTSATTIYEGGTCSGVANGSKLEVKGVKQTDGSILAGKVEFDFDELEGTISDLSGTCPSLTFKIGTTTVTTGASTTFSGVACSALANGTKVEVKGTLSGTTLAAVSVKLD